MQAVVLAGGRGTRLRPFSDVLPKPLFPIGGLSLAEILVRQLKGAGVTEIIMCLGYMSDLITAYFQDGAKFGLQIRYSYERNPLGTAGPLTLANGLADDFLLVNGDELTNLNFADLFAFHKACGADLTIAVQNKPISHNCGVLEIKEGRVLQYLEKPSFDYWVSMGIYVLSRKVVDLIPKGERFDIPDLVQLMTGHNGQVFGYTSKDLWLDIGTLEDLRKAQDMDLAQVLKELGIDKEGNSQ